MSNDIQQHLIPWRFCSLSIIMQLAVSGKHNIIVTSVIERVVSRCCDSESFGSIMIPAARLYAEFLQTFKNTSYRHPGTSLPSPKRGLRDRSGEYNKTRRLSCGTTCQQANKDTRMEPTYNTINLLYENNLLLVSVNSYMCKMCAYVYQ